MMGDAEKLSNEFNISSSLKEDLIILQRYYFRFCSQYSEEYGFINIFGKLDFST